MPLGQYKSRTKCKTDLGRSLLKHKVRCTSEAGRPDRARVTALSTDDIVSYDDFINTNSKYSSVDESSVNSFLHSAIFNDFGDNKALSNLTASFRQRSVNFDGVSVVVDKFAELRKSNSEFDELYIPMPIKPVTYARHRTFIKNFMIHVGSCIKYLQSERVFWSYGEIDELFGKRSVSSSALKSQLYCKVTAESARDVFKDSNKSLNIESLSLYKDIDTCVASSDDYLSSDDKLDSCDKQFDGKHEQVDGENDDDDSHIAEVFDTVSRLYRIDSGKLELLSFDEALSQLFGCHDVLCVNSSVFDYFISSYKNWALFMTSRLSEVFNYQSYYAWKENLAKFEMCISTDVINDGMAISPYEKNFKFWQELWFTLDKSDVLLNIVDARAPLLFYNKYLSNYIRSQGKEFVLVLNKADYLTVSQREIWKQYFASIGVTCVVYSSAHELVKKEQSDNQRGKANSSVDLTKEYKSLETTTDWSNVLDCNQMKSFLQQYTQKHYAKHLDDEVIVDKFTRLLTDHWLANFDVALTSLFRTTSKLIHYLVLGKNKWHDEFASVESSITLRSLFSRFTKDNIRDESRVSFGTVGFPNVGKSSLIKSLITHNVNILISSQPGLTKKCTIYGHFMPNADLYDCPGLIFPVVSVSRNILILHGILNINNIHGSLVPTAKIVMKLVLDQILKMYKLQSEFSHINKFYSSHNTDQKYEELLELIARKKGTYKAGKGGLLNIEKVAQDIIREFVIGKKLCYVTPPPSVAANGDKASWNS